MNGTSLCIESFEVELAVLRRDQFLQKGLDDPGVKKFFLTIEKIKRSDLLLFDVPEGFVGGQGVKEIKTGR